MTRTRALALALAGCVASAVCAYAVGTRASTGASVSPHSVSVTYVIAGPCRVHSSRTLERPDGTSLEVTWICPDGQLYATEE